jgi:NADH:ubiquinone oxidoreductase subunit H
MISYEISLGAVILSLLVVGRSLNFTDLVLGQKDV